MLVRDCSAKSLDKHAMFMPSEGNAVLSITFSKA